MKKEILRKTPLFLVLVVFFSFILINGRDINYVIKFDNSSDYIDITNNNMFINKSEPSEGIVDFKINSNNVIKSLEIMFNNTNEDTKAKIYYSRMIDSYSEINSFEVSVKDNYCVAEIPIEEVQHIMIRITENVELKTVNISNNPVILEKENVSTIRPVAYAMNIIFALITTYLICKIRIKNIIMKIRELFRNKKNISSFCICTVLLFILMTTVQIYKGSNLFSEINNNYAFNTPRIALMAGLSVIGSLILLHWNQIHKKLESIFLCLSLIAGLLFAIYLPVFLETTWDAAIHYENVNKLSTIFYEEYTEINNKVGGLEITYNVQERGELSDKYNKMYETSELIERESIPITSIYTFIGYIPMAVGLYIARGLGLAFSSTIIFARIMSSLFYSVISYLAIKKMQRGKIILFIVALSPTIVLLSGTYSYDTWIISLFFLGLAYLFANIQSEEKLQNKDILIILGSLFLGCGPKAIYFPIFALCFLMPKDKFVSRKQRNYYYSLTILLTIITIITIAFPMLVASSSGEKIGDFRGGSGINGLEQIIYILTHPIIFTKNVFNFMKDYYFRFENLWMCTGEMGYLGLSRFYLLNAVMLIINLIIGEKSNLSTMQNITKKLSGILIVLGTIFLVITTFYIMYTPVGAVGVSGCQIRYKLPILFPFIYMMYNSRFVNINRKYIINFTVIISFFVLYSTVFLNLIRLYTI